MKQTTEQKRAKAAWEQISRLSNAEIEKFTPIANGAASLIQKVGLGQALAFWISASGKMNQKLADFLAERILRKSKHDLLAHNDKNKKGTRLMEEIMNISSKEYRKRTNETIAYLFWLKRFAKAQKDNN